MPAERAPAAWHRAPPPSGRHCWSWRPRDLQDLVRVRREFRIHLSTPADGWHTLDEDQVTQAVLALDELMSNALRHGRAPVDVHVGSTDDGYVLVVGDRANDEPPLPTRDRDPRDGGMGLSMIADTALTCGWDADDDVKSVWALMPAGPRVTG